MKLLVLVLCAFASASAGYASIYSPYAHNLIGPNGVPVDTPEVQAAKASHFAAHASAHTGYPIAPLAHLTAAHIYGVPGAIHNGLPLDTPEVAAAKQQHHIDYAVAAQRNGVHVHAPVAHLAGPHPVDTPEVQLAKAAHFAAHAAARHGLHYRKRRALYPYGQHIPVIGPNGVPVETPEVQAAKAYHFAAHAQARGYGGHAYPAHAYEGHAHPYSGPWRYTEPAVIGPNGQPVETPAIQAAKAAHFAAHARLGNPHFYHH